MSIADVGHAVKRLQHRHHRGADAALAPLGISLVQWDVLRHLDRTPDASLHALAQATFQTDQSMGTLAARMVDRGLIERVPGPGRAVKHRLTPRGAQLRAEGQAVVDGVLRESLGSLDDAELATLGRLLDKALTSGSPAR
jgi:DNA-binding MarR family transcriptional regulator